MGRFLQGRPFGAGPSRVWRVAIPPDWCQNGCMAAPEIDAAVLGVTEARQAELAAAMEVVTAICRARAAGATWDAIGIALGFGGSGRRATASTFFARRCKELGITPEDC